MKRQVLLVVQIFLLIFVILCGIVAHIAKNKEHIQTASFGNTGQNTDFYDLADRLYTVLS